MQQDQLEQLEINIEDGLDPADFNAPVSDVAQQEDAQKAEMMKKLDADLAGVDFSKEQIAAPEEPSVSPEENKRLDELLADFDPAAKTAVAPQAKAKSFVYGVSILIFAVVFLLAVYYLKQRKATLKLFEYHTKKLVFFLVLGIILLLFLLTEQEHVDDKIAKCQLTHAVTAKSREATVILEQACSDIYADDEKTTEYAKCLLREIPRATNDDAVFLAERICERKL